jgi:oligopeptide transport system permease protein
MTSASPVSVAAVPEPVEKGNSLWHDAWLRLRKNKLAVFGMCALALITVACLLGPLFSRYGYEEQNLELGASAPSSAHWLGTDTLGRDLLVRLLFGGRISLAVGLAATFVALTIGVVYGAVAGFFGGKVGDLLEWVYNVFTSIPSILLIFAFAAVTGRGVGSVVLILGLTGWTGIYRLVRAEFMKHAVREYVRSQLRGHFIPLICNRPLRPCKKSPQRFQFTQPVAR